MELLMAAAGHGPGRHGAVVNVILLALLVIAVGAGMVGLIRSRKRSAKQSAHDESRRP
jgi:hypothetical protein